MDQQGVTVGRRASDRGDAGGAAGARPVLDHERLAELPRHLIEHDATDHVVRGAGRERDGDHDVVRRPGLRRGRRGREDKTADGGTSYGEQTFRASHGVPPGAFRWDDARTPAMNPAGEFSRGRWQKRTAEKK